MEPAVEDLVDMVDGEEEDLFDGTEDATEEDVKFDHIVGVLENIVMDPEFRRQHESFCRGNCGVFENTEENKLVYTTLFQEYTELTEMYIERRLAEEIEGFSMEEFSAMLETRPDEISGDLFDLLLGFGDFDEFKSLMLSYKEQFGVGGGVPSLAPVVTHLDGVAGAPSSEGVGAGAGSLTASVATLSIGGSSGQSAGSDSAQLTQSGGEAPGESRAHPHAASTSGASTSEGAP